MREKDFREVVRGAWQGWCDGREPQRGRSGWGSGKGAPDLSFGVSGIIVPVELKRAKLLKDGRLSISESDNHDDQIKWHDRANGAGIFTFYLVGLLSLEPASPQYGIWRAFPMLRPVQNQPLSNIDEVSCFAPMFTKQIVAWIARNKQE